MSEISRIAIADSTCLLILSRISSLDLLRETFGGVTITPEIRDEFGGSLPSWVRIERPARIEATQFPRSLGVGEISAIQLASESSRPLLILDDKNARKFAKQKGLDVIGTLGVLLEAKRLGKIDRVRPTIEKLLTTNFYGDKKLLNGILHFAKEDIYF